MQRRWFRWKKLENFCDQVFNIGHFEAPLTPNERRSCRGGEEKASRLGSELVTSLPRISLILWSHMCHLKRKEDWSISAFHVRKCFGFCCETKIILNFDLLGKRCAEKTSKTLCRNQFQPCSWVKKLRARICQTRTRGPLMGRSCGQKVMSHCRCRCRAKVNPGVQVFFFSFAFLVFWNVSSCRPQWKTHTHTKKKNKKKKKKRKKHAHHKSDVFSHFCWSFIVFLKLYCFSEALLFFWSFMRLRQAF